MYNITILMQVKALIYIHEIGNYNYRGIIRAVDFSLFFWAI
jgi:hypothetical protein